MSVPSSVNGEDVDSPGIGDRDAHTSSPPSQATYSDISSQISTLALLSARHGEILDRVVDRLEDMGTRLDLLWTHKNPDLGIAPVVLTSRTAEMSRLDIGPRPGNYVRSWFAELTWFGFCSYGD